MEFASAGDRPDCSNQSTMSEIESMFLESSFGSFRMQSSDSLLVMPVFPNATAISCHRFKNGDVQNPLCKTKIFFHHSLSSLLGVI